MTRHAVKTDSQKNMCHKDIGLGAHLFYKIYRHHCDRLNKVSYYVEFMGLGY